MILLTGQETGLKNVKSGNLQQDCPVSMFNLANLTFINSIIRMKVSLLNTLSLVALLFLTACQNKYRQTKAPSPSVSDGAVSVSGDAYQVTAQEYDQFFETRYGLLFQKFSDGPFTGRVLTVEKSADGGEYVASDESWAKGRKHGVSSRWFSNGVKMYERNYDDGKWHGTVTRWWPNGQKMYVRAYSDGLKRGKEATWRSDGTPIDLVSRGETDKPSADEPVTPQEVTPPLDSFPPSNVTSDEPPALPGIEDSPAFPPTDSSPGDLPALPGGDEPPAFPPLDSGSGDLPPLPGGDEPALPPIPAPPGGDEPPAFPPLDSGSGDLPPLPGGDEPALPPIPAPPGGDEPALPPLDSGSGDLPPLPGGDEPPAFPPLDSGSGDLPPLPGAESPEGDPPPLPAFPE